MTDTKLEIRNLKKSFRSAGKPLTVLEDLSLTIQDEDFVTLLGPSGCGKTTTLTLVAGFQKPDAGFILLNGKQVSKPGPDRSFVFQNYALFPWMTVRENILFPMQQEKIPKDRQQERLDELLTLAHLRGQEHLYPHQISGGMKQRTALIRAMASTPQVMLMDEPLGALDLRMKRGLQKQIETLWLAERTTCVMVTHDVDEAVYLSDRILVMATGGGQIVEDRRVTLPRPRDRNRPEYIRHIDELSEILTNIELERDVAETSDVETVRSVIQTERG